MEHRLNILKDAIKDVLSEMAYPASFNLEDFNSIRTFGGRKAYCDQRLQRISSGSSRIVYKIDDDKCLKLAKNTKGIAQNEEEIHNSFIRRYIGAMVYAHGNNNEWLEMQLARKARKSDFKRITGYSFDLLVEFISYTHDRYARRKDMWYIDDKHKNLFNQWFDDDNFYETLFGQVYDYLTNTCAEAVGDYTRLSSWGVVTDEDGQERLVVIDYGLNDEIYRKYYARPRRFYY